MPPRAPPRHKRPPRPESKCKGTVRRAFYGKRGWTVVSVRELSSIQPAMTQFKRLLTLPNLCRLLLVIVLVLSVQYLRHERPPWKSAWSRHLAAGQEPSYGEHVRTGLWWGAAARAGLSATLLALSLAWSVKGGAPPRAGSLNLGRPGDIEVSPRTFWITLGVIVLIAGAMRLPRMT